MWRSRRRGLLRNAAIVLGNHPSRAGLTALAQGLHDEEPLVRAACAWAVGRSPEEATARQLLESRRAIEVDPLVVDEIQQALDGA